MSSEDQIEAETEDAIAVVEDEFGEENDFSETDVLDAGAFDETAIFEEESSAIDFVGESSLIFDVEDVVAQFEAEFGEANPTSRLRRRLEAIAERKRRHEDLIDFADYDIDP
jgi:hypothetical protein